MDTMRDPDPIIPAIADDGSFYPVGKLQAHQDAIFHLAVSVFVFSGNALLIQKRAGHKYHCGGQWANTCCTHPHWDEPLATSAARRLREELGFCVPLREHGQVEYSADVTNGLHEHERVTMFVGQADRASLAVRPDPEEVAETRWVTAGELSADIARRPMDFTPWFRIYCERFPDLRL